jgi:ABC-type antimicrobial peptide transport system permease subunit
VQTLWQDARYGTRLLWRNPTFTAVAIFVTALGIGANAAIFSVVNAVLLRPLAYDHPERLLRIMSARIRISSGSRARPMESLVSATVARQRFSMTLIMAFAGLALALAAVGSFSVMSFLVAQRTHEIGVRMALGAQPRAIVSLVVRHGAALTLVGVAVGLGVAFAVTRVMQSLLYEVSATDTATFIIVPVVVTGVALVACVVPARCATKVDPMVALRYE